MTTLNLNKGLFTRALKLAVASYLAITLIACGESKNAVFWWLIM